MNDADRIEPTSSLSKGAGYSPASDETIGILKQFGALQSADILRNIAQSKGSINDAVRDELTSFLSKGVGSSPASGVITSSLRQVGGVQSADILRNFAQ